MQFYVRAGLFSQHVDFNATKLEAELTKFAQSADLGTPKG
jgi:hypothetical protein